MESQFLDIEFSLGKDLTPYLLQVRAITTQDNWNRSLVNRINSTLQGVHAFTVEKYKKLENVYGETTILGQMPDWNPIEMIGRAPRALALSLYQTLITSHAWSDAREIMGYMVPTGQPLMVSLAGQPFIDTRLSFHSYLPSGISPIIAEKLVNHWVSQLKDSPELHDKIEFDIAITAFSFDIDDKIDRLIGNVLTDREKKEFKQAHLEQTRSLVKGCGDGSIKKALDKIKILSNSQGSANSLCDISLIFPMMSNCIRYGTTPFSILARHGFIAKTLLLSLFNLNIITKSEVDQIQSSIHTIASDLVDDIHALRLGNMSYGKFMSYYGHLRPGTYDIRSQRYDQMGDVYNTAEVSKQKSEVNRFQFTKKQSDQVNRMLIDIGF